MTRSVWLFLFAFVAGITLAGCGGGASHIVIVIDNTDPAVSVIGSAWDTAPSTDGNGSYGPDFLWHEPDQVNVSTVRYTPTIETAGSYRVDIYWSADPNRTADQPVIVHDNSGDTTYHVNLKQHGHQWFTLGTHTFDAGTSGYIDFTTDTAEGYCNADAVRLVSTFTVD